MLRKTLILALAAFIAAAPAAQAARVYNIFVERAFRNPFDLPLGGIIPVVTAGPIFDGLSEEEFASLISVPGKFARTRFAPGDPNDLRGVRWVFAFGVNSPVGLCRRVPQGGGASDIVSMAICIGTQDVRRATFRRGRNLERDLSELTHAILRTNFGSRRD
ncbi:MAG: hypothetical protein AAFW69_01935 [Pseudomonadota bacterium]